MVDERLNNPIPQTAIVLLYLCQGPPLWVAVDETQEVGSVQVLPLGNGLGENINMGKRLKIELIQVSPLKFLIIILYSHRYIVYT